MLFRSQHESEHREPVLELRRFLDEIQKRLLLGQGQSCLLYTSHFPEQVYHLDGTDCAVIAFITCFGACPLNGLFDVFGGRNTKEDGNPAFQRDRGHAFGNHIAYIRCV